MGGKGKGRKRPPRCVRSRKKRGERGRTGGEEKKSGRQDSSIIWQTRKEKGKKRRKGAQICPPVPVSKKEEERKLGP